MPSWDQAIYRSRWPSLTKDCNRVVLCWSDMTDTGLMVHTREEDVIDEKRHLAFIIEFKDFSCSEQVWRINFLSWIKKVINASFRWSYQQFSLCVTFLALLRVRCKLSLSIFIVAENDRLMRTKLVLYNVSCFRLLAAALGIAFRIVIIVNLVK